MPPKTTFVATAPAPLSAMPVVPMPTASEAATVTALTVAADTSRPVAVCLMT